MQMFASRDEALAAVGLPPTLVQAIRALAEAIGAKAP